MIPGPIVLFGSGETSPSAQKIFDRLLRQLPASPQVALLETPAGFELNSAQVIGRVADYLARHLQNYDPQVSVVAARKRGTAFSPDEPGIVAPLFRSDLIFMGPGSPSYAVRQLGGSLAWHALVARHRLGAALALSSAATVAISAHSLPVYEIYKVGEDLHWIDGLDLFGAYGLRLVFIPHWNNSDGGPELDTSRCWMGRSRFEQLMELLPAGLTVMGIDEKTGLLLDFSKSTCHVIGAGGVTLLTTGKQTLRGSGPGNAGRQWRYPPRSFQKGESFPIQELGEVCLPEPDEGLPPEVWQQALETAGEAQSGMQGAATLAMPCPPDEMVSLVERRENARRVKDWPAADALRRKIAGLGWQVTDTPDGPRLVRSSN